MGQRFFNEVISLDDMASLGSFLEHIFQAGGRAG